MRTTLIWKTWLTASLLSRVVIPTSSISAQRIRVAHFAKIGGASAALSGKGAKGIADGAVHGALNSLTGGPSVRVVKKALENATLGAPCDMCLYLMETLDHTVGMNEQENTGFGEGTGGPSHAVHWPQNLPPTLTMPGFANPLGNQPLTHDAIAGPGFSLLETASSLRGAQALPHELQGPGGSVLLQTGSRQGASAQFINGMKAAGSFIVCRPGLKYCRPRLLQMGARAAQRKLRMQAEAREQQGMQAAMIEELTEHCQKHVPPNYQKFCVIMSQKIIVVAGEYLHDYSDDEICTDIDMCDSQKLGIPGKPAIMNYMPKL